MKSRLMLLVVLAFWMIPMNAQVAIPGDALAIADCTVKADGTEGFDSWFMEKKATEKKATLNGFVMPADSIKFPNVPDCSFFKWSKQMFLWLTSPDPDSRSGGRIFDSHAFFDVLPPVPDPSLGSGRMSRTLVPHKDGMIRDDAISIRTAKEGPRGLPVIRDKDGRFFELEQVPLSSGGMPVIPGRRGAPTEIYDILRSRNGKAVFLDGARKQLRPLLGARIAAAGRYAIERVQEFRLKNGKDVFVNPTGEVIEVDPGQADQGVLLTQSEHLVYYITMVNDVFAYYRTMLGPLPPAGSERLTNATFPTKQEELDPIIDFADTHDFADTQRKDGKLLHGSVLAVEVKAAFVELTAVEDRNKYITIEAMVPTYDTSDMKWTKTRETKKITLALVGMHVVGSAAGHPEMIWATFEHLNNAPNAPYDYVRDLSYTPVAAPRDTSGTWTFCDRTCNPSPNEKRAVMDNGDIKVAAGSNKIGPSNIRRENPWGKPGKDNASSNTRVISIHNSVDAIMESKMPTDVRRNYYMVGATWLDTKTKAPGGTTQLSNTTMESFQQGKNCLECHQGSNAAGVSHIFRDIKPLDPTK